jgi:hypothetical protein
MANKIVYADPILIEQARQRYQYGSDDNIEIDDEAETSEADEGIWVQAWVWVPKD